MLTSPNAAAAAASTDLRSTAGVMAALPRLFVKLASFGYFDVGFAHIPDNAAYIPPVAEAATTSSSTTVAAAAVAGTATSAAAAAEVTAAAAAVANQASKASTAAAGGATRAAEAATRGVAHEGLRSVESIFTYMSSKWAVLCLFMVIPRLAVRIID